MDSNLVIDVEVIRGGLIHESARIGNYALRNNINDPKNPLNILSTKLYVLANSVFEKDNFTREYLEKLDVQRIFAKDLIDEIIKANEKRDE